MRATRRKDATATPAEAPGRLSAAPSLTIAAPTTAAPTKLTYAAGETSDRRRASKVWQGSEESILTAQKRAQITANSRDLDRNFEAVGWAIRRHLDYVCDFEFAGRSKDKGFNRDLEDFIENWSLEENFEASERFSREQFTRLAESRSILDGDILIVRLQDSKVQAIEGDRVRNESGANVIEEAGATYWQGVRVLPSGKQTAFRVHSRSSSGQLVFEREIKADNARLYSNWPRFDSVRGVSPIASGINRFRDVYEAADLALAKAKISKIFGVKFTRNAETAPLPVHGNGEKPEGYTVDYTGPFQLDLDPGDDAEIMDTDTPGPNFADFMVQMLQLALKSLDIPFSFYNESFTNFFGSRAAWHHYERSCTPKRNRVRSMLNWLTLWRLGIAIDDGEFSLPSGMDFADVRRQFGWQARGMPWWKPSEEINGDLAAIAGGLTSPQRVTKSRGQGDAFDLIDERAELEAYAREKKVTLDYGGFIVPPVDPTADQQPAAQAPAPVNGA